MNKHNLTNIFFLSLLLSLAACSKDQPIEIEKNFPGVSTELWTYFEKFETEAANRGLKIDLEIAGITGTIEKIHLTNTVGLCNHKKDRPNHVMIDATFWETASENSKEMIIFHELGHCYLERGHVDKKKSDGTCASIMRSGKGQCLDFYNHSNKKTYLDELLINPITN